MKNPSYNNVKIDMFMAGTNAHAKAVARQLALDAGFENCYDFGNDDTRIDRALSVAAVERLAALFA